MSFFHNLNKKLDSIAARPEPAQLNERDMGKHNNATTGFKAVADKAAKEYGSKAAGERVAEELDPEHAEYLKRQADVSRSTGLAVGDRVTLKNKPGFEGKIVHDWGGGDFTISGSGGGMSQSKNHRANARLIQKIDEAELDEVSRGEYIKQQDTNAEKSGKQKFNAFGQTFATDEIDEGGLPMTTINGKKVPKFAADGRGANDLAKKKSFNDKIAGAKKEVDEMLGDVAAEAMKSALGGGKGRNAEMDEEASQDNAFTAHKRPRVEQPPRGSVEHGSKHDIKHDTTDPRYSGRIVTRRVDPQGISVGADDDTPASGEKRGRGRPKGPARAPERVTGGATRHKGGRKMTKEGGGMMKHTFAILDDTLIDQIANMNGAEVDPDAGSVETYDENTARQLIAFAQKNPQRLKRTQTMNTAGMRPMARHSGGSGAGPEYNLKEVGNVDIADQGEYDQEGDMAKDTIKTVVRHAQALEKILGDNDNLPEWVQSKLAKIESMMTAVDDYMQNQETDQDDEMAMGEEKTSTRDNRAERAGKRVAKDIEYDEKKKDGIHGKKRGSEDNKADKAGKKVTKDIEHDEKEDDEKEDKPKKSKSKFKFGGSVYENLDAQLETLINESMNISVTMATTDDGQQDSNSITVTASGEDAMTLAQLLKSAGLTQSSHSGCSVCGQSSCGCEQVDENSPDYPTNTETSNNAFQYSGGLNKPKSTGQTTTPVLASQLRRQVSMEESVKIERNLFDLYKNFTK